MYQRARYLPAGDKALSIELGDAISPEISARVRALLLAIQKQNIPGVVELVPSYRSILAYYDPLQVSLPELEELLRSLEESSEEATVTAPKVVELPTVYGGDYGPDLGHVAESNDLTSAEVIRIHSGTDYLIYMMGFAPGFPYLGGLSERIATPRLQTPRTSVPAGSVGIAERQTGVYPNAGPGGWQLIGRTPVRIFDPQREPPVLLEAGDYLRFVPVTVDTYRGLERQVRIGVYQVTVRPIS